MPNIFLNSVLDRMKLLMNWALVAALSGDESKCRIGDRIDNLNKRLLKYDSDLSWKAIEKSKPTEDGFLKEIEELEAAINS